VATSQSAWLMNASLRDNILFGEQFDKEKYDRVIERCALRKDIDGFPGGDQTEIGERGINLSGGKKSKNPGNNRIKRTKAACCACESTLS
jgi:ABC-type multidrug transport system fused ATPase/permease subunit